MNVNQKILSHLRRKPITPYEALSRYGCFRLASRIYELRDDGHNIVTHKVRRGGKTYAQYRLAA